jgi:hypothetical protein
MFIRAAAGRRYGFIVFSASAQGWPLSQPEIDQYGAQLFAKWGGVDKAKDCFPNLEWSS